MQNKGESVENRAKNEENTRLDPQNRRKSPFCFQYVAKAVFCGKLWERELEKTGSGVAPLTAVAHIAP
jgi:hypothetical protein